MYSMSDDKSLKYLAIGDSYTIGTCVEPEDSFPLQLSKMIEQSHHGRPTVDVDIIAKRGWTTTDLLKATDHLDGLSIYDFATLLIGVNNQYDGISYDVFVKEFERLVERVLRAVNGRKDRLVILSLPDYAYTPYGQAKEDPTVISTGVQVYNDHIKTTCDLRCLSYISLIDLSKEWLSDKSLVASDGLHLSGNAYKRVAQSILGELELNP